MTSPSPSAEPESADTQDSGGNSTAIRLRNGLIALAVFGGLIVGLLLAIPSLRPVIERMTDANIGWSIAAVSFQLLCCASYSILFGLVFPRLGRRLDALLSLAELAVNSVVSAGGVGGLALGAWVLRSKGIPIEPIARRSVALFLLTSAVNVAAVILIGIPMWLGLLPGSRNPLLTLLPAVAAILAIVGTLALGSLAKRGASGRLMRRKKLAATARMLGGGVEDSLELLRGHDWRLLGAVGYWLFNDLVLYVCLLAYGGTTSFWAVSMAYLVGMLANSVPTPGGFVAVEGGLVGMLLLFHARPAGLVLAAVLTYRAISLWIPSIIGSLAFLGLRREIGRPLRAARG